MVSEEILEKAEKLNVSTAMVSATSSERESNQPERLQDRTEASPKDIEEIYDGLGLSTDSLYLYVHDLEGDCDVQEKQQR